MLYILRGLPGSGKTTFAKTLCDGIVADGRPCMMVAADDYFYGPDGYVYRPEFISDAHDYCQRVVAAALKDKIDCIVHNTCTRDKDVELYIDMAKEYTQPYTVIVVENRHGNDSVHGVPLKTLDRMESQLKQSIKLRP